MDKRAVRSVAALRKGLLECMREKPVREIQIKDICAKSGLNKTTFYKYYSNLDALVCELEAEQLDLFRKILLERKKSGAELLRVILASLDEAKILYHADSGGTLPDRLRAQLVATAGDYGVHAWKERIPKVPENEAELVYEALLGGALQAALSADASFSRDSVVRAIMGMFRAYIEQNS